MYFTWWDRLEADLTSQPIHATTFHSSGDYLNDMLIFAIIFFACTDPYPYSHPQPFVCCVMAESSRDFNLEYEKRVSTHRNTHHSILYLCHTLDINRMAWEMYMYMCVGVGVHVNVYKTISWRIKCWYVCMCKILHRNGTVSEIAPFSLLSLGNYDEVIFAYICWSRTAYLPRITSKVNETTDRHQALCIHLSLSATVCEGVRLNMKVRKITLKSARERGKKRWLVVVIIANCHNDLWKFPFVNPVEFNSRWIF